MTSQPTQAFAKAIFDQLPGHTRREKSAALTALIGMLRAERDTSPRASRSARTLTLIRDQLVGKSLADLHQRTVNVDGVTITVAALAAAYLMPQHALHGPAKKLFAEARLAVAIEPTGRRPARRIVEIKTPGDYLTEFRAELAARDAKGGAA